MATYDITVTTPSAIKTGDVLNCPYSGSAKSIVLPPGKYKLECWGAQGGYRSSASYSGKGGYSVGTLTLQEETTVYLLSGGAGNTGRTAGGFNGGGKRSSYPGGGGASDVRIKQNSLYARVIVAGGGGSDGASNKGGGYGGGTTGQSRTENYGTGGYGGTQTGVSNSSWQTGSQSAGTSSQSDAYAGFGFGGNGVYRSSGYGGAGGGGWYGGSGSYPDSSGDDDRGGGGGSGFVWTGQNAPSGYLLNSEYYLESAATKAGNQSFNSPTGSAETGHTGDGYVRITVIEVFKLVPDVPSNFRQTSAEYFSIGLSWDASEDAIGYYLYRDNVLVASTSQLSYTDDAVSPNRTYTYSLKAYNTEGSSDAAIITANTKQGFAIKELVVTSATITPNPVEINTTVAVKVTIVEEIRILEPEVLYSGELYSGEG